MEPEEFLKYLWGPTPPGKILIWTMPDKLSYWFNRPAGVNALVKASPNKNFYLGMALAPADFRTASRRRTKANQTTAIPALWADVDFRHDVHKEPNLPPSAEAALETLQAMPDKPTLIIHSGHGLQAYWVLTAPWVFNSPMDRIAANTLTQYWHQRISLVFGAQGWSVDATHDLSRVMRLPGTTNFKQEPVAVTIVMQDGPRYQKDDLLGLIPDSFEANIDKTLWDEASIRPPGLFTTNGASTSGHGAPAGSAYPAALHHNLPRGNAGDAPTANPAKDETPADAPAAQGPGTNGPLPGQQLTGDSEDHMDRVRTPEHPPAGDRNNPGPTRAAAGHTGVTENDGGLLGAPDANGAGPTPSDPKQGADPHPQPGQGEVFPYHDPQPGDRSEAPALSQADKSYDATTITTGAAPQTTEDKGPADRTTDQPGRSAANARDDPGTDLRKPHLDANDPPVNQNTTDGDQGTAADQDGPKLVLDPDAVPPDPQFFVLKDNDPKFRATWEGKRPDLSGQTASHYDMSIASIALATGWSDQQVVDTIIARRRLHGQDLKLRESYYVTTIKKAKHPIRAQHAQDTLDEALESKEPNRNNVIRESLTTLFGVEIKRIVKYLGDPPIYWMSTAQGNITLGQVSSITSQQNFRNLVAAATNVIIPKCPPDKWDKRAQAILNACQEVSLGDASHPAEETKEWLRGYLSQKPPVEDRDQANSANAPFIMTEYIYFFLDPFRRHVEFEADTKIKRSDMAQRLRQCRIDPETVHFNATQGRTTRNCWKISPGTI